MRTEYEVSGVLVACALGLVVGSFASADPGDEVAEGAEEAGPIVTVQSPRADELAVGPVPAATTGTAPADTAIVEPEPEPNQPGRTPAIEHREALASFFTALARTEGGAGITRVTHLGDSSIGLDGIPHGMRARLQEAFGDAGTGFVVIQQPTPSYMNRTVRATTRPPWQSCVVVRRCRRDGHYGLGGVVAESRGGSSTTFVPLDGRTVSHAELWYLALPRGGRLRFELGEAHVEIDTDAPALEDRWHRLEVSEPGPHTVRVSTIGGGRARVYGVVIENGGPGVVWDTLPMVGAFTHRLLAFDEAHFARQLAHRSPDLIVLSYGGNDLRRVVTGAVDRERLEEEIARVLGRVRAAVPETSCLVVGINDHIASGYQDVQPVHVETVIAAQRAAAARAGCAFWDQVDAMGGAGSFRRWMSRGLAARDGKHLSARGRAVIAARLHAALMHARP